MVPAPPLVLAVRAKFEVLFALDATVTDWLLLEYPVLEAVKLYVPGATFARL